VDYTSFDSNGKTVRPRFAIYPSLEIAHEVSNWLEAEIDCTWGEEPRFQVHSVPDHHGLAFYESGVIRSRSRGANHQPLYCESGISWCEGDFATAIQNAVSITFLIADDVDGTMVEAARFIVSLLGLSPDQGVS